jgi:hypothetical protein
MSASAARKKRKQNRLSALGQKAPKRLQDLDVRFPELAA